MAAQPAITCVTEDDVNIPDPVSSPKFATSPAHRANNTAQAPHPPLTRYYPDESARHQWLRQAFDRTAGDYDRVERLMAFGTGGFYRRRALARSGLVAGMKVLDVGAGTGLTAIAASHLTGSPTRVLGVDPSVGMLFNARLPSGLRVIQGRAEQLPVKDGSFDFLSMGFALRHVTSLDVAFSEFWRVLRPGGRFCLLEITRPQSPIALRWLKMYMRRFVPMMARLVSQSTDMPDLMRYYWDSIEASLPPSGVTGALSTAAFVDVERRVELGIFTEYVGRKRC